LRQVALLRPIFRHAIWFHAIELTRFLKRTKSLSFGEIGVQVCARKPNCCGAERRCEADS
jgi:hypothetical protein